MRRGGEIVYVALGSNLGDREGNFAAVLEAIEKDSDLCLLRASSVFETEAVGPPGQGPYLNAVVELRVWHEPLELLTRLHAIERAMGRDRRGETQRWGPRKLDLDIIFFGDREIELPTLIVPHRRAHERNFVMTPLAEIVPALIHPQLGKSAAEIAGSLPVLESAYVWAGPNVWPPTERAAQPGDPSR
jgi:2-amino-4-hydroxy-6-hydroxymethyldihydropteridine diphosphokinase